MGKGKPRSKGTGHSVGGKGSGGKSPTESRPGTERAPDTGTPASDEFKFPTTEPMPTRDGNK